MAVPLFNIGGLASGLDTGSIIESLIQVERIPIVQLQNRISLYDARDAAWQEINTKFSAVRSALDALRTRSDLDSFVNATSSNETAVTATPTGAATPSTITFSVDQLATNHQVVSRKTYDAADELVGAGTLAINVGETQYEVNTDETTTLEQLAGMINSLEDGPVTASVVAVSEDEYKLLLTSKDTGEDSQFTLSGTASLRRNDKIQDGANAEITIGTGANALTLSRSSNTVTDLIPGISIDLHEVTTAPVTVTTTRDTAAATEKATELADAINAAITTIEEYIQTDPEAGTSGVLAGDSTARSLLFDLRSSFSGVVNEDADTYATSGSIGFELTRDGTLNFDSSKLQAALDADFDEVANLLIDAADDEAGLFGNIHAFVDQLEGSTGKIARARDLWKAQTDLANDEIDILEDRILRTEERLVKKFAALEVAMANLSAQSAWLSAQLTGAAPSA